MNFVSRMRYPIARPLPAGFLVLVVAISAAMGGCASENSTATMTSYSTNQPTQAAFFTLPPEQMSHIQIVSVEKGTIARTLRLPGSVAYNAFQTTPVITQIGGPVLRIAVVPGESVRKDQPMLYITSPDYSSQAAGYLKARSASELADKNYARAKDLYDHHAIAERDLQQAELD